MKYLQHSGLQVLNGYETDLEEEDCGDKFHMCLTHNHLLQFSRISSDLLKMMMFQLDLRLQRLVISLNPPSKYLFCPPLWGMVMPPY